METLKSIHGHEVIRLILSLGQPCTPPELERIVLERFGAEARFHTCSHQGMTPGELLRFLFDRGKLKTGPEGIGVDGGTVCGDSNA